jgi:hypothetical protein
MTVGIAISLLSIAVVVLSIATIVNTLSLMKLSRRLDQR